MPNLYVNPTTGRDVQGIGDTPTSPLRTITYAITESVRRFGASFSTIYLADGYYTRASGEEFPILIPQNISVIGAGIDRSFIDYERNLGEQFDLCLFGGRELSNFSILGHPLETGACRISTAIHVIADDTYLHHLAIQLHPSIMSSETAFDIAIRSDDLRANFDNLSISGCLLGIVCSGAAVIEQCTFNNMFTAVSMTAGSCVVDECTFEPGNLHGVDIAYPSLNKVINSVFNGCQNAGVIVGAADVMDELSTDKPLISHNQFNNPVYYGIICDADAVIEDNQFNVTSPSASALVMGKSIRHSGIITASPEIRENIFNRSTSLPWSLFRPLVVVNESCTPLFEFNTFSVDGLYETNLLSINHDANPDLGGGSWGSQGQNRFQSGWIEIQADAVSVPRDIYAQDNYWKYTPPRHGPDAITPGDYFINPREAEVVMITEGAMHL